MEPERPVPAAPLSEPSMHSFSFPVLATAMSIAVGLTAQTPDSPAPQHALDPSGALRGLSGVQQTDEGIQGRGEAYRVDFSTEGAELTPYFGAAAAYEQQRAQGQGAQRPATPAP